MSSFLQDYTLRMVLGGVLALGIFSGALGSFAVLRRQSLLGDALSHAALPGIVLAFLLSGSRATGVLLLGAAIAGWLGTLAIRAMVRGRLTREDSALGIVLSVFFGLGLVLLTWAQRLPGAGKAGLDKFLFGQAATLVRSDVLLMCAIALPSLLLLVLFWKELKLLTFDAAYARALGLPVERVEALLTLLLVLAIVIGLQTVGVVLMSAMLIAPAAAARQWTDRLSRMVALAALAGALSGAGGVLLSSSAPRWPTGPAIVLCASLLVVASLLFAPHRGILWSWLRFRRNRRRLDEDLVLYHMLQMAQHHAGRLDHPHARRVIQSMTPRADVRPVLHSLEQAGWVRRREGDSWSLTSDGAERALSHRAERERPPS